MCVDMSTLLYGVEYIRYGPTEESRLVKIHSISPAGTWCDAKSHPPIYMYIYRYRYRYRYIGTPYLSIKSNNIIVIHACTTARVFRHRSNGGKVPTKAAFPRTSCMRGNGVFLLRAVRVRRCNSTRGHRASELRHPAPNYNGGA